MRLLLLLWAMLASLGLALSGATAAASPVEACVSVGEEAVAEAHAPTERPCNRVVALPAAYVALPPLATIPLFADRRRE